MGSDILTALETDSDTAPAVLEEVPGWFEQWEQVLSRFRINSELSCLNRSADQTIPVSPTLWDVYQLSLWADEFSNGLVTPTILDAMLEAGYEHSFESLSRNQWTSMSPLLESVHPLSTVVADAETRTITLPHGVHLDFGGVAKGWAAHQAMQKLKEFGPCLVNAGGDIAVSSPRRDGRAWKVGVSNPFEPDKNFDILHVKQGGVASSGRDRRVWRRNGLLQHHLIHPLTGQPVETNVLRVTIIASTVMEAEAAAKTAFILGADQGLEWIEAHSFAGIILMETGEAFHSQSMQEYIGEL